jgi:putative ABC transport system permease protein
VSVLGRTWRSIWRFHGVLAGILVLEYAFTFAIVLATSGMLVDRIAAINQNSGVQEHGLYVVRGEGIDQPLHRSQLLEAAARLRALAGRGQVAFGSSVPFYGSGAQVMPIGAAGDQSQSVPIQGYAYQGDADFASVLGLRQLQGRGFQADDITLRYGDSSHLVMLSESLAQRLFHGEAAVGKPVRIGDQLYTVIGVTTPLAAPAYVGAVKSGFTFLLPEFPGDGALLLARYGGPVAELNNVIGGLNKSDAGSARWVLMPYTHIRTFYFTADRQAVAALAVVMGVVLVIALCGILGLTNYWVSRRRRQIAMRRALGATKQDIGLHFLGESGLLVVPGLALGLLFDVLFSALFGNLHLEIGPAMLLLSMALIVLLAGIVVSVSLRRWLRMNPVELMRSI